MSQALARGAEPDDHDGSQHAQRTVLLVEDDAMVRRVAKRVLQNEGFRVIGTSSAEEAVSVLRGELDGHVDALLTDLNLPGMGAPALLRALHGEHPGVPVILMSGYAQTDLEAYGVDPTSVRFLAKPFTAHGLAHTVAEVLEGTDR